MSSAADPRIEDVLPARSWQILEQISDSVLIDVRTRAEWAYVGVPDISQLGRLHLMVEWAQLPDMSLNPHFVGEVMEQIGDRMPSTILFLCRSGVRSLRAATAIRNHTEADGQDVTCLNIASGFEGDLNDDHHRGCKNGWKVAGLPWRQS